MIPRSRLKIGLLGIVLILGFGAIADEGVIVEEDLFVGVWSPHARRWVKEVPVCIWSEDADRFRVIATGLSPGQRFAVSNGMGDLVRYNVSLRSGRRFRSRETLRQNIPSRRVYRSSTNELCIDGENARVRVVVNKRQIDRAVPAIYTDTLLLVLSPL
ncbi:MAG: hypothetical protein KTR32_35435 [Granulosicoccus sp.]|nr:hypothetical protein [Granulosicoccus sp.]